MGSPSRGVHSKVREPQNLSIWLIEHGAYWRLRKRAASTHCARVRSRWLQLSNATEQPLYSPLPPCPPRTRPAQTSKENLASVATSGWRAKRERSNQRINGEMFTLLLTPDPEQESSVNWNPGWRRARCQAGRGRPW